MKTDRSEPPRNEKAREGHMDNETTIVDEPESISTRHSSFDESMSSVLLTSNEEDEEQQDDDVYADSLVSNLPFTTCESFNDLFDCRIEGKNYDEEKIVRCIEVPKLLRSHLTSRKIRCKIKNIAKESRSLIEVILPKKRFLRIIALKEEQITLSEMRLTSLLLQIKHKLPFTHFVSIPFNHESLQKNFATFRDEVLKHPSAVQANVDELLFQNPNKIHLTFGILVLMTDEERTKASRLLQQCSEEIVKPILGHNPLVVDVKGVDVMNRDASKAHVLYAKIQNNTLQRIADEIVDRFVKAGLMGKQKECVKLHVTLMNSLFRLRKGKRQRRGSNTTNTNTHNNNNDPQKPVVKEKKRREHFDAREIVKSFADYTFAENLTLSEIHLSKVSFVDKDGYYSPMEKVILG